MSRRSDRKLLKDPEGSFEAARSYCDKHFYTASRILRKYPDIVEHLKENSKSVEDGRALSMTPMRKGAPSASNIDTFVLTTIHLSESLDHLKFLGEKQGEDRLPEDLKKHYLQLREVRHIFVHEIDTAKQRETDWHIVKTAILNLPKLFDDRWNILRELEKVSVEVEALAVYLQRLSKLIL